MPLTGRRVLVVEDDDALRRMLEQRFSSAGCVVRSASEGQEALTLLDADTPDLIVLDLMLPWVNGIEVLGRVRQQPRLVNVPVLVTTGTATTPFDLRDFGPLRVIRKPFDGDAILAAAQKLLNG